MISAPPEGAKPVAQPVDPVCISQALNRLADAIFAAVNAFQGKIGPTTLTNPDNAQPSATTPPDWEGDMTLRQALNEFLRAKARQGKCDRYIRQLRVSIGSLAKSIGGMPLKEITRHDVDKWLTKGAWTVRTQKGYLGDLKALFNFAIKRGYIQADRATFIELPEDRSKFAPVEIHTPEEVQTVMESCRKADLDVCRHMAIRYFAGLRSAEAHRIREENILLDQGYIEVPASMAKTRRRRLVKIQPNLAAWLALGGVMRPMSADRTIRRVLRLSEVRWPKNVTRHSFVSYHLAKFENAGKSALEAGHSEDMLFAHYRALVTREQAEKFWSILPRSESR